MKLEDHYRSLTEFEEILEDARMQASNDREVQFVKDTQAKYDDWGGRMFWSEAQDLWIRRIAGADDY